MQMKGRCMHISNGIWIEVYLDMFTMGETHRWGTFAKMPGHS
jgi:hypothetical protein